MMTGRDAFDKTLANIFFEFPKFRIVYKRDSKLMRAISWGLRVLTLGKMTSFMTSFHTTIGMTLYAADAWDTTDDAGRTITLRHELVHMRQNKRLGRITMGLAYLFIFFPIGLAYGRMRLEREAYEETLKALAELRGKGALTDQRRKDAIVSLFTGPSYLWMWPFKRSVERWYDRTVTRILTKN